MYPCQLHIWGFECNRMQVFQRLVQVLRPLGSSSQPEHSQGFVLDTPTQTRFLRLDNDAMQMYALDC